MNTLGNKIRVFRKLKGFSQLDLELSIGASTGTISRIENNDINPTKETIHRIAKVLKLNNIELEYLIGYTSTPASNQEILYIRNLIKKQFCSNYSFAYILDDRNRLIDMSEGFKRIIGKNVDFNKIFLKSFPEIILNEQLGIRGFLDKDTFSDLVNNVFKMTYLETHFMQGDEVFEEMLAYINSNSEAKEYWDYASKNINSVYRNATERVVIFNYLGLKIKLEFSLEPLMENQRFRVIDYKPSNILLKVAKSIIN